MRLLKIFVFIIITALLSLPVFGQDDKPIRIDANLVNINVAISDKKGSFVEGLNKANFEVLDNGVSQEIETFSAEEAPISFGIVYDMHPASFDTTKAVLESLREFTRGLREQDDFFTVVFNKRGSLSLDFVPTAEQVRIHLNANRKEPSALYDALFFAATKLRERRNLKRVILVITDSADHNSEHRFDDVLDQFKTLDANVFAVIVDQADKWKYRDISGDDRARSMVLSEASSLERAALVELALRTGGTIQSPTVQNAHELYRIYKEIALQTRKQYALGFYPKKVDGKFHKLKVRLRSVKDSKKINLTYRMGYQSPKPN
jgi:Ca-activated chloride channel family protein